MSQTSFLKGFISLKMFLINEMNKFLVWKGNPIIAFNTYLDLYVVDFNARFYIGFDISCNLIHSYDTGFSITIIFSLNL